jgi:hypothetical protein
VDPLVLARREFGTSPCAPASVHATPDNRLSET